MAKRRMHLAALALTAASASANFVITSPVADQVCVGGIVSANASSLFRVWICLINSIRKPCTVSWYDDGTLPAVASYGEVDISLYVGSGGQGVQVRHLQNVNVNELVQIDPVIDPAAGPDGSVLSFTRPVSVELMRQAQLPRSFYFVRIQSLEDPTLSVDSQQITLAQMTGALSAEASAAVGDVAPACKRILKFCPIQALSDSSMYSEHGCSRSIDICRHADHVYDAITRCQLRIEDQLHLIHNRTRAQHSRARQRLRQWCFADSGTFVYFGIHGYYHVLYGPLTEPPHAHNLLALLSTFSFSLHCHLFLPVCVNRPEA